MRLTLFFATLLASAALAGDLDPAREATPAEADAFYLGILHSSPADEAMGMLTDVGIDKSRARKLLTYLDEQFAALDRQYLADTVGLCRNLDGRFSNPYGLAQELSRQQKAARDFQATMVQHALGILGVDSLAPVRGPHMNGNGALSDTDVVDEALDGRLIPADAIARACEVTEKDRASVVDDSDAT